MIQQSRPITALASRVVAKQTVPLVRPAASVVTSGSRGFASASLNRGGYGTVSRGGYSSLSRGGYSSLSRGGYSSLPRGGYGVQQPSIRWKSDSSPSLRKWGFEEVCTHYSTSTTNTLSIFLSIDFLFSKENPQLTKTIKITQITSSLPTESSSPTHTPHPILVDVREPAELTATGIIPSAVSVPLGSQPDALFLTPEEFETRFGFPKPGESSQDPVVFYCKAGVRARTAAQLAVQAGYDPSRVGIYEGSWTEWAKKGGKVEKWEGH